MKRKLEPPRIESLSSTCRQKTNLMENQVDESTNNYSITGKNHHTNPSKKIANANNDNNLNIRTSIESTLIEMVSKRGRTKTC
mmetsp:Transcript_16087/g.22910  ORF Transcript_16087/g.22910 Transcript_16087/m.22910 type:complete len:83 (-) Transcript_16087:219-467(-)